MKKAAILGWLLFCGSATGCGGGSATYKQYTRFAETLLRCRWEQLDGYLAGDAARVEVDRIRGMRNFAGITNFTGEVEFTSVAEKSIAGGNVSLEVIESHVTDSMTGTPQRRFRHKAEMTKAGGVWKVVWFEYERMKD